MAVRLSAEGYVRCGGVGWGGSVVRMTVDAMPVARAVCGALTFVEETDSTNTLARTLVLEGAARPALAPARDCVHAVVARRQTAGRGRLDHTWVSRPGESFTASFVVAVPRRIMSDGAVNGWLQMLAGLATLDALEATLGAYGAASSEDASDGLALKWPNDVFLHGRKLGGILAEVVAPPSDAASDGGADDVWSAVVFGVGLNLAVPADGLPTPQSTSLQLHFDLPGEATSEMLCDLLTAGVARALRSRLGRFLADPYAGAAALREEAVRRCHTLGRRAVAHFTDGSTLEGEAVRLASDASLVIRDDAGTERTVRTADVGVLPDA